MAGREIKLAELLCETHDKRIERMQGIMESQLVVNQSFSDQLKFHRILAWISIGISMISILGREAMILIDKIKLT